MLLLTKHTSNGARAEASLLGDRYPHPLDSAPSAAGIAMPSSAAAGESSRSATPVNLAKYVDIMETAIPRSTYLSVGCRFGASGSGQQTRKSFGSSAAAAAALAGKKGK
jgi:hypothetical protein